MLKIEISLDPVYDDLLCADIRIRAFSEIIIIFAILNSTCRVIVSMLPYNPFLV